MARAPSTRRVRRQLLGGHGVDSRERRGARDRVAAEGGAVVAGAHRRHHVLAGADRRQGEAAAEGLGHRHDVGGHAVGARGEPVARAAEPGLDLVEDQQRAMGVGALAQALEERPPRGMAAAVPLDRLDHVAGGLLGGELVPVELVQLGERVGGGLVGRHALLVGPRERRHLHPASRKAQPEGRLGGGGRERPGRAAVEAAPEAHHPGTAGRRARQAQRGLVGLGSGGGEEEAIDARRRDLGQPVGQIAHGRVTADAAEVDHLLHLPAHGGDHGRMAVAEVAGGDPGRQVHVRAAVGGVDPRAVPPDGVQARDRRLRRRQRVRPGLERARQRFHRLHRHPVHRGPPRPDGRRGQV